MKNIILTSLVLLSYEAWSLPQNLTPIGGSVEFLATTRPVPVRILGKGASVLGHITLDGENISGKLGFPLATLTTGIGKRDEHMREKYLEVEKYPSAELTMQKASPIAGWTKAKPGINNGDFVGTLNLHGVTKPVTGKFNVNADGKVDVQLQVKLSDYNITKPSFAGISVDDKIEVEVKIDKFQ
jgi:polyisoprenoid-binding protein YceI